MKTHHTGRTSTKTHTYWCVTLWLSSRVLKQKKWNSQVLKICYIEIISDIVLKIISLNVSTHTKSIWKYNESIRGRKQLHKHKEIYDFATLLCHNFVRIKTACKFVPYITNWDTQRISRDEWLVCKRKEPLLTRAWVHRNAVGRKSTNISFVTVNSFHVLSLTWVAYCSI